MMGQAYMYIQSFIFGLQSLVMPKELEKRVQIYLATEGVNSLRISALNGDHVRREKRNSSPSSVRQWWRHFRLSLSVFVSLTLSLSLSLSLSLYLDLSFSLTSRTIYQALLRLV